MIRYFDITRKIIAGTTTDGWQNIPHCSTTYDADVSKLYEVIEEYNRECSAAERISLNSAMLKVIIEGIKASPPLNGHVSYSHRFVSGSVAQMEHIDISTPVLYAGGKMMTVTLPHMEDKSIREIQEIMNEFRRRIENTDMEAVQYQAGLNDTLGLLRHGRVFKAGGRLIGAKTGKGRICISRARLCDSDKKGREGTGLTPDDIRQGSITISSLGPVYRTWNGFCSLLQVVPPQVCAIAVGAMQKKPVVDSEDNIEIRRIITLTNAWDHRAVDFSDLVPYMKRMDEVLGSREIIRSIIRSGKESITDDEDDTLREGQRTAEVT